MTPTLRRAALTVLILVGAALCAPAGGLAAAQPAPPPGLGIRLLEAPTKRADDPRARLYIVDRVAPGARFTRRFEVSNGDDEPMDVRLYTAPATVAAGSFAVQDAGVPGEITRWASVTPESVRIPPRSTRQATVSFRVDPKATEGEYYGGVVAERPATRTGAGLAVNLRVALRVYLSVGPGGEPASDFTVDTLTAQRSPDGAPVVVAQVKNTGGRALDLGGRLRLADGPGGLSAGPFEATLGTTLGIGQTQPVTVTLDKALPAGPWKATLELASGVTKRSARGVLTFPEQAGAAASPVPASNGAARDLRVLIPVAAGLLGLVAVLLVLSLYRRRRSRGGLGQPR